MPFTRAREPLTHTGALSGQCLRYAPFMIPFDSPGQRAIVDALRAHLPQLDAVILFGSLATGHARADSDADLAVFGAAPYAAVQLFDARMAAEAVLRRTVDLVDLRRAPPFSKCKFSRTGTICWARRACWPAISSYSFFAVMKTCKSNGAA